MSRELLLQQLRISEELMSRKAANKFELYVQRMKRDYDMQWFHRVICRKLDLFAEGKIKNMMILVPPQHGKSELASRLFPSYIAGRRPDIKAGLITYNSSFAQKFNRQIQRNIDNYDYVRTFKNTSLNNSKITGVSEPAYVRNTTVFDIVGTGGSMMTVGRNGQITGVPLDLLIIDDLYKNREEAVSQVVSESVWQDYNDVFKTRLHNDSQQLIMNTRWDDADLVGRLLLTEPENWEIIKFQGIRTEDILEYDPRPIGEALWPAKHSLERLRAIEQKQEVTFNSLYQQDPKPNSSLLVIPRIIEIPEFPKDIESKYWGLDFGFTNDPTALVKCANQGPDLYLDECCYEPGIPMKYVKEKLVDNGWKEGEPVWCDHVDTHIAELRRLGVSAFPAVKGPHSIQAGLLKLKEFNIHVTKRSVNMRLEQTKYTWVAYGTIITNEPSDQWNHTWDAARYGVYTKHFRQ